MLNIIDDIFLLLMGRKKRKKRFVLPVIGETKITSPFGWRKHPVTGVKKFHYGVDLRAPEGTPLVAVTGGVIERVWENNIGGKQVLLRGDISNLRFGYSHLSDVHVKEGERVSKGQVIGLSGSTGMATGPHLHFSVKDEKGNFLNPEKFFDFT